MPRFVILLHETPQGSEQPDHFDLMLERGESLQTWRLERFPAAGEDTAAERIADHRLAYLNYEGEVSGGRGRVRRIAFGEYELLQDDASTVEARLKGASFNGVLTFCREEASGQRWRVSFLPESGASLACG